MPTPPGEPSASSDIPPSTSASSATNSFSINGAAGRAAEAAQASEGMNIKGASAAQASKTEAATAPGPAPVASSSSTSKPSTAGTVKSGGRVPLSFSLSGTAAATAGSKVAGNALAGVSKIPKLSPKKSPGKANPLKLNPLEPSQGVKSTGTALQALLSEGEGGGKYEEVDKEKEMEQRALEELKRSTVDTGAHYGVAGGGGGGAPPRRVSHSPSVAPVPLPVNPLLPPRPNAPAPSSSSSSYPPPLPPASSSVALPPSLPPTPSTSSSLPPKPLGISLPANPKTGVAPPLALFDDGRNVQQRRKSNEFAPSPEVDGRKSAEGAEPMSRRISGGGEGPRRHGWDDSRNGHEGGYGGYAAERDGRGGGAPKYRPNRSPSPEYYERRSPSPYHSSGSRPAHYQDPDAPHQSSRRHGHERRRSRSRSRSRSPHSSSRRRHDDGGHWRDDRRDRDYRSSRPSRGQYEGQRDRDAFRSHHSHHSRDARDYSHRRSPSPHRPRSPRLNYGVADTGLPYDRPNKQPPTSSTPSAGYSPPPKKRKPSRSPLSDSGMESGSEEGEEREGSRSPKMRSVLSKEEKERVAQRMRNGGRDQSTTSNSLSRSSNRPLPPNPIATASPFPSSRRAPPPPPPPVSHRAVLPPPPSLPPRPEDPGAPYHPANPNSLPSASGVHDRASSIRSETGSAMQMSPAVAGDSRAATPLTKTGEDATMAVEPAVVQKYAPPKVRQPNPGNEEYFRAPRDDEFDAAFAVDLEPSEVPAVDAELQQRKYIGSSHISEYTLKEKLGEGTFGVVWRGIRGPGEKEKDRGGGGGRVATQPAGFAAQQEQEERAREKREEDELVKRGLRVRRGDVVALKQIIYHNANDGMPITSVREIRILKMLDHPNVVPVVDIALDPADPAEFKLGKTYMVFPYMDHDLAGLLENPKVVLQPGHIKQYAKQLLEGTAYLHRNLILHRDMKAANLLISNKGQLMIADFGLARSVEKAAKNAPYTSCVVTRWYRPPELLLSSKHYHAPIDMWGVGCVLAEMYHRIPIFPGSSDIDQLARIFALCGSPTPENFPGWSDLPGVEGFEKCGWMQCGRFVAMEWERRSNDALFGDLMDKLLVLDPKKRLTAEEALDHDWFWTAPYPTEPSQMPQYSASHEMDRQNREKTGQPSKVPQPQALPPALTWIPVNGQPGPVQPPPMPPTGYAAPVGAFNGPPPGPVGAFTGPPAPMPPGPPGYGGGYPPPPPGAPYGGGHGRGPGGGGGPGQHHQSFAGGGMRLSMSRGLPPGPQYGGSGGGGQQWQSGGRGAPGPGGGPPRAGGGVNLMSLLKKKQ